MAAKSHLRKYAGGLPVRWQCPQLVIAAIALQHARVEKGQEGTFVALVVLFVLSTSPICVDQS